MEVKVKFILMKPAQHTGGDRYVAQDDEKFQVYFPQRISRAGNGPKRELYVIITDQQTTL